MKKAALTLVLLGLCATAIFFVGWIDLLIPHGQLAVIRSKTGGVHSQIAGRGSFTWMWERLLPTNVDLVILSPKPMDTRFAAKGTLPSAELYRQIAGSMEAFSWELAGHCSFDIGSDKLVELVASGTVNNNEELMAWYTRQAGNIEESISRWFGSGYLDNLWSSQGLKPGLPVITDQLVESLKDEYPDLSDMTLRLDVARYPDIALYRSAAELYRIQITNQQAVMEAALLETSRTGIYTQFTLSELERYGALFEKYPSLISFTLALEAGTDGIKELLSRIGTR